MAQQIRDPALFLLRLRFLLWHRLDPWPGNFTCGGVTKKNSNNNNNNKTKKEFSCGTVG